MRMRNLLIATPAISVLIVLIVSPVTAVTTLTPSDIRGAYNVGLVLQSGYSGKGVTVAIVNTGIDSSFYDDVKAFNARYGLSDAEISVVRPYGPAGTDQELPEGETTTDAQLLHATAPDARILLVLVGTHSLLDGFTYVIDNDAADIAVLSPSWAYWGEGARELVQSYNSKYSKSVDKKITLIAASNDWGSNNTVPWGTVVGDFWTDHLPDSYLMPQYSPYVTAIGGTVLTMKSGSYGSETGWDRSGGGPSNLFAQPSWQTGFGVPNNGFRNIPDLALNAACETAYGLYWKGRLGSFCGNGLAAIIFAGIVADMVQAAGGRLGFLNPSLYSIASSDPSVFHDVTSGCSLVKVGSATRSGYCASRGWDFVTGWGSPDAVKLTQHLAPNALIIPEFVRTTPSLQAASVAVAVGAGVSAGLTATASATGLGQRFDAAVSNMKIPDSVKDFLKFYAEKTFKHLTREELEARKRRKFLSGRKLLSLAVSALVLVAVFSYVELNGLPKFLYPTALLSVVPYVLATVVLFFVVRVIVTSAVAASLSVWCEFRIWLYGLIALVVSGFGFLLPFGSPGRTDYEGEFDLRKAGLIAALKIFCDLAFMVLFYAFSVLGYKVMGDAGLLIATMSAYYSSFPFKPLEGKAVYRYSKPLWVFLFAGALVLFISTSLNLLPSTIYLFGGLLAAALFVAFLILARRGLGPTAPTREIVRPAGIKYCIQCGELIPEVAVYCPRCAWRQE
jgi:hypothetical protein